MQKILNNKSDKMSLKDLDQNLNILDNSQVIKIISNLVLAVDYTVSFYKNNLYIKYRNIRSSLSLASHKDQYSDLYIKSDLDFVADNFFETINLMKELQSVNHNLVSSFVSNPDIRSNIDKMVLLLNMLKNRKIFSQKSIDILKKSLNNLSLSVLRYNHDIQQQKDILSNSTINSSHSSPIEDDNLILDLSLSDMSDKNIILEQEIKNIIDLDVEYTQPQRDNNVTLNKQLSKDKLKERLLYTDTNHDKRQINKKVVKDIYADQDMDIVVSNFKNNSEQPSHNSIRHLSQHKNSEVNTSDRGDMRRQIILKILSTGDFMSIKDISDNVSGCSEKTVQRDLNTMLDMGLIKKTGEKRWSRYSMV